MCGGGGCRESGRLGWWGGVSVLLTGAQRLWSGVTYPTAPPPLRSALSQSPRLALCGRLSCSVAAGPWGLLAHRAQDCHFTDTLLCLSLLHPVLGSGCDEEFCWKCRVQDVSVWGPAGSGWLGEGKGPPSRPPLLSPPLAPACRSQAPEASQGRAHSSCPPLSKGQERATGTERVPCAGTPEPVWTVCFMLSASLWPWKYPSPHPQTARPRRMAMRCSSQDPTGVT